VTHDSVVFIRGDGIGTATETEQTSDFLHRMPSKKAKGEAHASHLLPKC
jgi:hypothetical protein